MCIKYVVVRQKFDARCIEKTKTDQVKSKELFNNQNNKAEEQGKTELYADLLQRRHYRFEGTDHALTSLALARRFIYDCKTALVARQLDHTLSYRFHYTTVSPLNSMHYLDL